MLSDFSRAEQKIESVCEVMIALRNLFLLLILTLILLSAKNHEINESPWWLLKFFFVWKDRNVTVRLPGNVEFLMDVTP